MIRRADALWNQVTRWAPILGKWQSDGPNPSFEGSIHAHSEGVIVCDEKFRDGIISVNIRFQGEDGPLSDANRNGPAAGIIFGYQSEANYHVAGLGAFDFAYAVWQFQNTTGSAALRTVGSRQNLRYDHEYRLEVKQTGQRISITVDGVPVLEHVLAAPPLGNQLGLFARSAAPQSLVYFKDFKVQRKLPSAFVAMQFGGASDAIYRSVIRPIADKLGFEVVRIDEVNRPGIIFQDIQKKIEDAKVVIAEITTPNQNVYYEVGYAHALNKPTILLAQRDKELPFDVRSYRVIFYDDSIGGKQMVERTLKEHLQAVLHEL